MRILFSLVGLCLAFSAHSLDKIHPHNGSFIVKLKGDGDAINSIFSSHISVEEVLNKEHGIYLVKGMNTLSNARTLSQLRNNPQIEYAQYDHYVKQRKSPNDKEFKTQWSLNTGKAQADINANQAWELGTGGVDSSGNQIVVAVVDGGVDLGHSDLERNIWVNEAEIGGNGVDDDQNGYVDDLNGWNAYEDNGKIPVARHGTHVAGIIGAVGNNKKLVSGVNWDVKIMSVAGSSRLTSTIVKAYGYVMKQKKIWMESSGLKGANVVATNSSFGVDYGNCESDDFPVWNDLYNQMGSMGILSAAATINDSVNVDENGDVPTGCSSDFLVTVTNTNSENKIYEYAGFGANSIDLGAPGTEIVSTVPEGKVGTLTGTSMATPHVAGAIAFLHSVASTRFNELYLSRPAEAVRVLKAILLNSVDFNSSLDGKTQSGGKLNLFKAASEINAY
ncbi:MAG: S8 family serine peptidase [Bacteriovoracaceae bacterium]|jgi:subtilisin family serine protease|nr:S8 family serine peptidase [Bacteriovoracaceae bacterium]